jgi:hypothetical protein
MKRKLNNQIRFILLFLILIFVLLHVYFLFEYEESTENSTRTLEKDGFCCFKTKRREETEGRTDKGREETEGRSDKGREDNPSKNHENERTKTLERLPPNYVFLDYEYTIYSAALSTFHRDVTSSQTLYNCQNPVYTLIVYEYEGDLLSICPASERTWPFVWTRIVNLSGPSGTCVLFNSEMLHAGLPNHCRPRFARQYKICHQDDIKKLGHLQGVRAKKDTECIDDVWSRMKRKISYYFAFVINHVFYPFLMQKWGEDTWMGKMQTLLPDHQFYNNI